MLDNQMWNENMDDMQEQEDKNKDERRRRTGRWT